jgi:hypothetical protein
MAIENPKITTARLLIEVGSVQSFSELFTKGKLPVKVLAEATGKSYYQFKKMVDHPSTLQREDIIEIAGALGIDPKIVRDLVDVQLGKKEPRRGNGRGNQN